MTVSCMRVQISEKEPDLSQMLRFVQSPSRGAINSFLGVVRNSKSQAAHSSSLEQTVALYYEAYQPMAEREFEQILDEAEALHSDLCICVYHRVGTLKVGEIALVLMVAAPHRKEAIKATTWVVDEIKKRVPIFKKELFESGSQWVGTF